jgi:hypothetical protein
VGDLSVRTEQIEAVREVLGWTRNGRQETEYDEAMEDVLADIVDAVNKVRSDREAKTGTDTRGGRVFVWCGVVARCTNFAVNKPAMCTLPPGVHVVHVDQRGAMDLAFTDDLVVERPGQEKASDG